MGTPTPPAAADEPGIEDFRTQARSWLEANLERRAPDARRPSAEYKSPEEIALNRRLQRTLFDGGYAGISFPHAYGGRGLSFAHERAFSEEAAEYVTPDLGGAGYVTFGPIARSMLAHASHELLSRHIPKMLSGEEIWCQFYSEPEAGSDLAGIRTTARRDGDRWVIRGSKIWTTGGYYADWAMCLARTNWDVPKHRGLTWFAVPTDAKGVTIRPIEQISGSVGFSEEFLDDVEVGDDAVIWEVDHGWAVAQTMLVYERGGGGERSATPEPRQLAPDLVDLARHAGRSADPVVRQLLAQAHINDFAQHHLVRRVASRLRAADTLEPAIAAYAKLAAGTLTPIRARIEMEIGGPAAVAWDDGTAGGSVHATNFLNGRILSIAAGTNEMQRNSIGERVLGLPREPSFDAGRPFSEVLRRARDWTGATE